MIIARHLPPEHRQRLADRVEHEGRQTRAQIGQRDLTGRQANQQFGRIIDSGQHLLGIINDFLDCAKIEAGKLSVEQITIEPGQVIDSAITLTAERAFARGLNFEVRENGLPSRCQGDPLRLSQVLVNLLGNAIKYTNHGVVTILKAPSAGETLPSDETRVRVQPKR